MGQAPPGWQPAVVPDDVRAAAALLLIYPREGRPPPGADRARREPGRNTPAVSLPGEPSKRGRNAEAAALREATEKWGSIPRAWRCSGACRLCTFRSVASSCTRSWAASRDRPAFHPDPREVARVVKRRLALFGDPHTVRLRLRTHQARLRGALLRGEGEQVWADGDGARGVPVGPGMCARPAGPAPYRTGRDEEDAPLPHGTQETGAIWGQSPNPGKYLSSRNPA